MIMFLTFLKVCFLGKPKEAIASYYVPSQMAMNPTLGQMWELMAQRWYS
jgi:hypothetical protein